MAAVGTGTAAVAVAGRAAPGHSPRTVNPAAAASASPATTITGARPCLPRPDPSRPDPSRPDPFRPDPSLDGADTVSRGGVDIEASAGHVPLACLGRPRPGVGLLLQRRRQPERAVRVRVGPVGHAV